MNLTPQFFITSDTHFDHKKLVEFGRPVDFNEKIVENWNKVVGKHDFVLHLGDLTMCGKEKTIEYTSKLNGTKYLIRGNHDGQSVSWFNDCGFTVVEPIFKKFCNKDDTWTTVLFTHEPVSGLPTDWFNIHGHLHGNSHRGNVPDGFRHYDAGVDANAFQPVRLFDILLTLKQL